MQDFRSPAWEGVYAEESRRARWRRKDETTHTITFKCLICFDHGITDRTQHDIKRGHNSMRKGALHRDPLGVLLETVDCLWGDVIKSE